jgi:hypothetical protein
VQWRWRRLRLRAPPPLIRALSSRPRAVVELLPDVREWASPRPSRSASLLPNRRQWAGQHPSRSTFLLPVQRSALPPPTPAVGLWHMLSLLERRVFTSPTSSVHTRRSLVCLSHLHLIVGDSYHVSFGRTKIYTERKSNFKLAGPTERQAS